MVGTFEFLARKNGNEIAWWPSIPHPEPATPLSCGWGVGGGGERWTKALGNSDEIRNLIR